MMSEYCTESKAEEEAPICGDVLEEIACRVALVDLVSASRVSSTWRSAISSSLDRLNTTLKPWLIIHSHSTKSNSTSTVVSYAYAYAYDPRSHLWMEIRKPPPSIHSFSVLRSSHSSLLYMVSSSRFAFSLDPLHLHWHLPPPPIACRPDPLVAAVGNHVILAGSACSLIDDHHGTAPPLEIYDTTTGTWESPCDSMPRELMDSGASTWLSVAVAAGEHKMYVSVKSSGVTYSFDPRNREWCDVGMRRRESCVFYSEIAWCSSGLIAVGLSGEAERVGSVVIWEVVGEGWWRMPDELLEKLKGEISSSGYMPSISVNVMGDLVFLHNPLEPREVIVCHLRTCRWESVAAAPLDDASRLWNLAFTASTVTLPHLEHAFNLGTTFKTFQN